MTWHLAQLNIGRLRAPTEDPATADFMANLDPINALAEASPGFVWRLQTDEGNATAIRAFPGDDLMILNMSVWESIEALAEYVYRSAHTPFLRRRGEWFERIGDVYLVLWWIPAGTLPTIEEALARLERLRKFGPTPAAFTFRQPFPHPGGPAVPADERNTCPVEGRNSFPARTPLRRREERPGSEAPAGRAGRRRPGRRAAGPT